LWSLSQKKQAGLVAQGADKTLELPAPPASTVIAAAATTRMWLKNS
jgi:hypothetical protein